MLLPSLSRLGPPAKKMLWPVIGPPLLSWRPEVSLVSEAGKTHHTLEHSVLRSLLAALGSPPPLGDVSEAGKTHHTVEHSVLRSLLAALGFPGYWRRLRSRQNAPHRRTLGVRKPPGSLIGFPPRQNAPYRLLAAPGFPLGETSAEQCNTCWCVVCCVVCGVVVLWWCVWCL